MEIGSEFWEVETNNSEWKYFVAGRTSLEFIIRDILMVQKVNRVHMPSYCCHTMIEPFCRHHIEVKFYDVYYENGALKADIPQINRADIFFYINYFGYENQSMGELKKIKESGCIVIEDATHSWLISDNKKLGQLNSDYRFVSYRKWSGFTGISSAEKYGSKFVIQQKNIEQIEYDSLRRKAQNEKQIFLQQHKGEKRSFLEIYGQAENILTEDYVDYIASRESLEALINFDKEKIKLIRRENAQLLLEGIADIKEITPIFYELKEDDVPLNVPILINEDIRDDFRRYLVSEQIFCPVHWPLSELHEKIGKKAKEIYSQELSLVCDQRYGTDDIKRFVECIGKYFGG